MSTRPQEQIGRREGEMSTELPRTPRYSWRSRPATVNANVPGGGLVQRSDAALQTLQDRLYSRSEPYRFGAVLVLLLLTFVYLSAAPPDKWAQAGSVVLESAAVLGALIASRASRLVFRISVVAVTFSVTASCVTIALDTNPRIPVATLVSGVLAVAVPVAIAKGLIDRGIVDARTILGALSIYISIGLFFAFLFGSIHAITGKEVFAQHVTETSSDFVYFSFVTLATVGYGDLTAAGGVGRAFAALEGMAGQLYLVTVVALLVSNLRPHRTREEREADERAADERAEARQEAEA
jgi:hypothetical protein